jgi:Uma2 family endonuclease
VIEVAATSLRQDLEEKTGINAVGGVPDYWVVDATAETVHVLQSPGPQ